MDNIIIRDAKMQDIKFMQDLIKEGVKGRHFLDESKINGPRFVGSIIELLDKIINKEVIGVMDPSRNITGFKYWAKIAEFEGKLAGMIICKTDNKEIEIHMLAVDKLYRRKGIANYLVLDEINRYKGSTFIARCYKKSTYAMALFKKIGFSELETSKLGTVKFGYNVKQNG